MPVPDSTEDPCNDPKILVTVCNTDTSDYCVCTSGEIKELIGDSCPVGCSPMSPNHLDDPIKRKDFAVLYHGPSVPFCDEQDIPPQCTSCSDNGVSGEITSSPRPGCSSISVERECICTFKDL
ncbi:MAG: hypothetical protein ABIF88_03825 [archaeon]